MKKLLIVSAALTALLLLAGGAVAASPAWLLYDNGTNNLGSSFTFNGVGFSLTGGLTQARLLTVRFYYTNTGGVTIHVTEDDHVTELIAPIPYTVSAAGWNDVDLSGSSIVVPENFYVVIERGAGDPGKPVQDDVANVGRSFIGSSLPMLTTALTYNLLLRAEVVEITPTPSDRRFLCT